MAEDLRDVMNEELMEEDLSGRKNKSGRRNKPGMLEKNVSGSLDVDYSIKPDDTRINIEDKRFNQN